MFMQYFIHHNFRLCCLFLVREIFFIRAFYFWFYLLCFFPSVVISFVTDKDKALCDAVRRNFATGLEPVFSRKRGFRRRIRKMTRDEMKILEEDE